MQAFLARVADHVISRYADHTGELCIVLPNRRAGLFLRQHLAKRVEKTIWAPVIFSIEDFVQELVGMQAVDNLTLLFELYAIHREKEGEKAEAFEEFSKWAQVFIQDVNELDRYLANTQELFGNLQNIKEIENWSLSKEDLTDFQRQYLDFFRSLGGLYNELKQRLLSQNKVYEGLAFRLAWEQLDEKIKRQRWKKIIFAGFNALNTSEERIMNTLVKRGLAEMLWDSDSYYADDTKQEAGKFLRRLLPRFQKEGEKGFLWQEDLLSQDAKKISVIGAAKQVAQAKTASAILEKLGLDAEQLKRTAVVLCDENLLFPVLHSLPSYIENVNVTMGYPLRNTPFAGLVEVLFNLHEYSRGNKKEKEEEFTRFYHRELLRLLSHPYIKFLFAEPGFTTKLRQAIIKRNYVFVSVKDLEKFLDGDHKDEFDRMKFIFAPWRSADDALNCFDKLIDMLRVKFMNGKERISIETEYIFGYSKVFKRLRTLLSEYRLSPSLKSFHSLIKQVSASASLPFYGEPLSGLQVMGVLETRTLDFENLILLSVNENVLPAAKTQHSFIPYDLKKAFDLPTYSDKDAVFAYHFYRLLQRAKTIYLLYNTETDEFGKGEKSRFITQLLYELPRKNPNVIIEEKLAVTSGNAGDGNEIALEKSAEVLQKLEEKAGKGFSPSALNTYKKCGLQFYFRHVVGLKETEEVEETIGADTLGTAIHKALEELYKPIRGKEITLFDIERMKRDVEKVTENAFMELYTSHELNSGKNLLTFRIAVKFIRNFLDAEKESIETLAKENKKLRILELELPLEYELDVNGKNILFKGNADRIDSIGEVTRIIDYKTGKTEDKELKLEKWPDIRTEPLLNKSFQLVMYAFLYAKKEKKKQELVSGIITFRELSAGLKTVKMNGSELMDGDKLEQFEEELKILLGDIFDPAKPFTQTSDAEICRFCSFRSICNK
ncbi:MAG TPA: PD-(D/E)XK nuclease family protein [Bacteroidia bacterium]